MNSQRNPEQIRERAYQLWERHGRRQGCAQDDWLEAERELDELEAQAASKAVDESATQSFPASDERQVNADTQWAAANTEGSRDGSRRARGGVRRQ